MSVTWNQDVFNRTIPEYMARTKRTLPQVLNTKAFFIARRTTVLTPRTQAASIRTSLGRIVKRKKEIVGLRLTKADNHEVSLAEAIIRARARRNGTAQPTQAEIGPMILKMINARQKSRAYLASGWLPAIKTLELVIDPKYRRGAPRQDRLSSQVGVSKGKAIPAQSFTWKIQATIENAIGASGNRSAAQNKALNRYGGPPLNEAFGDEVSSMIDYMNRQLQPDTDRFNRQQR